jgi:hypothetical protein
MDRQNGADGEVRRDHYPDLRVLGQVGAHSVQGVLIPTGGADNNVDAEVDQGVNVGLGDIGSGELDRHLRTGCCQLLAVPPLIYLSDQAHSIICRDRIGYRAAHSACCTDYRHRESIARTG